jgi:hypothetical protein
MKRKFQKLIFKDLVSASSLSFCFNAEVRSFHDLLLAARQPTEMHEQGTRLRAWLRNQSLPITYHCDQFKVISSGFQIIISPSHLWSYMMARVHRVVQRSSELLPPSWHLFRTKPPGFHMPRQCLSKLDQRQGLALRPRRLSSRLHTLQLTR